MKKYMLSALVTIFLAVGSAHAQSAGMDVDIPFDFVAGDTLLHAGKYTIRPVGVNGDGLLLRSADLKEAVLLSPCVSEGTRSSEGQLVFKVEGSRHYLWQVWTPGDERRREFTVRLREKKLIAATKGTPAVTVASIRQ